MQKGFPDQLSTAVASTLRLPARSASFSFALRVIVILIPLLIPPIISMYKFRVPVIFVNAFLAVVDVLCVLASYCQLAKILLPPLFFPFSCLIFEWIIFGRARFFRDTTNMGFQ